MANSNVIKHLFLIWITQYVEEVIKSLAFVHLAYSTTIGTGLAICLSTFPAKLRSDCS